MGLWMLTILIEVIISQDIQILDHRVYLKLICYTVNYISIKNFKKDLSNRITNK